MNIHTIIVQLLVHVMGSVDGNSVYFLYFVLLKVIFKSPKSPFSFLALATSAIMKSACVSSFGMNDRPLIVEITYTT